MVFCIIDCRCGSSAEDGESSWIRGGGRNIRVCCRRRAVVGRSAVVSRAARTDEYNLFTSASAAEDEAGSGADDDGAR